MPRHKNLLICFDAFGTLFTPRQPIAKQYGDVARSFGLSGFSDGDVAASFKKAFKDESKRNPNYGRATGLGAEKWWTNIVHKTFEPYTHPGQTIPSELAPKLIHRFNSNEGYRLYDGALALLGKLRGHASDQERKVVVGVITNSDDRTSDILTSLGVRVNPLRHGDTSYSRTKDADIDFTVLSYDVGVEKPDKQMFEAAEGMLPLVLQNQAASPIEEWEKVYVGDEYAKDVVGAVDAGWNAVLIDRENDGKRAEVEWLDDRPPGSMINLFAKANAVGFSSLARLAEWLLPRS